MVSEVAKFILEAWRLVDCLFAFSLYVMMMARGFVDFFGCEAGIYL